MHPDGVAGQGAGALAGPGSALNGVHKEFRDLCQADPAWPELLDSLGAPCPCPGTCASAWVNTCLSSLDWWLGTTSSTLCLWMAPPPAAGGPFPYHHHEDYKHPAHWDLVVAPELFTEEPVGSLLMGTTGVLLQCLRVGPGGP